MKSVRLLSLCFLLCSALHIQKISATDCSSRFASEEGQRYNFVFSSLSNENMLQITGLKPVDFKDLVILEVASGKNLFVNYLAENGAKAVLAMDRLKRPEGIVNEERYLKIDILESDIVHIVKEIKKKIKKQIKEEIKTLSDITIITSIFGVLNEPDTKRWLKRLIQFTKHGGIIIVDFLIEEAYRYRGGITQTDFEIILFELRKKGEIKDFKRQHANRGLEYEKVNPLIFVSSFLNPFALVANTKERLYSVTYRIEL